MLNQFVDSIQVPDEYIKGMDENDIDVTTGMRPYRTVFRQDYDRNNEIKYYSNGKVA